VMIAGALAVSTAVATGRESAATHQAIERECARYALDAQHVVRAFHGEGPGTADRRDWWDWLILACAAGVFIVLALTARIPSLPMNSGWTAALTVILVASAATCAWTLGKSTRFN
jgi:hypothetical protein